jgi:hypothetical protein
MAAPASPILPIVAARLQCHVSRILSRSGANATPLDDAADLTRS